MKSVIKEIYMGKSVFAGSVKMSDEYMEIADIVNKMTEEYMRIFNGEQKHKFMEFCDAYNTVEAENALIHYKEGFKLGLSLALECLNDT